MKPIIKEPVRVRYKTLSNRNSSIYLDIYVNGRRKYEFLKLYLVPEKSREDKERNKDTMRVANAVKAKRILDIQNGQYDFLAPSDSDASFFSFFDNMVESYDGETRKLWDVCRRHLHEYEKREDLTFAEADTEWVKGLVAYFKNTPTISVNSSLIYLSKFKRCFNRAVFEGIITVSPFAKIEFPRCEDREREYLTIEEVRILVSTPCRHTCVKNAFLFGCLTGLRVSDIMALTWGEVKCEKGAYKVVFRQKKTKRQEYMDITPQAMSLMGECGQEDEKVFSGLPTICTINIILKKWVKSAGINKHISFHCSRHTFAVMMLDLTSDIYTVSKLLGHRSLVTTQVYAKILDKNKRKAVQLIPDLLTGDK